MAKATFDMKSAQRVFHAGVGVTDLAVEVVRDYAANAQKLAQERFTTAQKTVATFEPRSFGQSVSQSLSKSAKDARSRRTAVEKRVAALQTEARTVPSRMQHAFDSNVEAAGETYDHLVKRGEVLIGRIRRQQSTKDAVHAAETTVTKAKTTRTQATKVAKATPSVAKKRTAAARSSAKATGTAARKTVSSAARALADAAEKVGD